MSSYVATDGPERYVVRDRAGSYVVDSSTEERVVVREGHDGPPGPPSAQITLVAGVALSGQRVVTTDAAGLAVYASTDAPGDVAGPFFLTVAATAAGDQLEPLVIGEEVELSWSWTPGDPVFLGLNGALSAVPGTEAFVLVVGTALTATSLFFDPLPPIILTS